MNQKIDRYDTYTRRCPKLGHEVAFSYCRQPGGDVPCKSIFDCWWERFDIEEFIHLHYSQEVIAKIMEPLMPKHSSLFELMQQAQQRLRDARK
jgi:hypothetical protein